MRWSGFKSRKLFYCLIAFGVASFLGVAVYSLAPNGSDQLARCWLYENDTDGSCDKVTQPIQNTRRRTSRYFNLVMYPYAIRMPADKLENVRSLSPKRQADEPSSHHQRPLVQPSP